MKRSPVARALLLAGVSTFAAALAAFQVSAQSVNYGALEQLYDEPVTTSVTGKPQKASDAPANLTIISADDIRRSGANTIPDILRFVAGIDVRQYSAGQQEVAVRGYNQSFNPRLLVMVNGRQVYLDDYGYVVWAVIPVQLEEIRQIEVVKGPNSALFGFNAASGVINIITYDPLFDQVNAAAVRFGSQALRQGSAVATAHLGDGFGVRVSVGGLEQHEFQAQSGLALPIHEPQSGAFNIDSKARLATGLELTLEASSATAQQNTEIPSIGITPSVYHTNSFKGGILADTNWGTVAVDGYRNWLENHTTVGFSGSSAVSEVYVLQASDTLRLNNDNIIRLGLEYRHSDYGIKLFGGTTGYQAYSASAMWDWQLTSALSLTNAVRVDYLTLNHAGPLIPGTGFTNDQYSDTNIIAPSFNSGLVYKVTDLDTVRLTAGRGLQLPSLIYLGLQLPGSDGSAGSPTLPFVGSPILQPTAVWNLEFGYDRGLPVIGSTARAAVFVQRNDNLIGPQASFRPGGFPAIVAQNLGYSDSFGGELGISGKSPSGFRWNASYAFQMIYDHTTVGQPILLSAQTYQTGTPTNVVILGLGYTRDKLEIDIQGRWQSRFTDYQQSLVTGLTPVYVSDYITSRMRVGYNLTEHVTLALTGQQFNVSRLAQTAGPPVERSFIGSATAHF